MTVPFPLPALLFALLPLGAMAQTYVDLDFSHNVQAATQMYPNNSTLGPYYSSASYMDFTSAGSYNGNSVDVRVSFLGLTDGESSDFRGSSTYQWVGWIPDYNTLDASNDLGVYYRHDGNYAQQQGGIAWSLSFFEGGGSFSTPITLPGVRLLIYDHDGEPFQSESIRAFAGDGLTGYQLHGSSGILASDEGGSYRFDAAGAGQPETTPHGGMILYYQNTSSIRFDMFSTTQPGLPVQNNGIFAAWDGDLGLTDGTTGGFNPLVVVPEPTAPLLLSVASMGMLLRRSRRAINA
ncbi:PEP-CTERM sorting domain-containing protein [Luteolibacter soli]|uniref:PEP-CTERM sorting domain-containing protein n=1 Tax=Luteolibacter soli TaxID=3135280 RepID=A0ABU9B130_9BACT